MPCPRCGTRLDRITQGGVLVDVCERCLGVWLDRAEMQRISTRLRHLERDWDDRERRRPARPPVWRDEAASRSHHERWRWTEAFEIFD